MSTRHSTIPRHVPILIIGAGLTGLSAATTLGEEAWTLESSAFPGGVAASIPHEGFLLDRGVHILYCRDPWTLPFLQEAGVQFTAHERKSAVALGGRLANFPLQFHLGSLPPALKWPLGLSALRAQCRLSKEPEFEDMESWARGNYGEALSQHFFTPYNEKLWGVPLSSLGVHWMEGYVPPPSARAVLAGLLSSEERTFGENAHFYYPTEGGIGAISNTLASRLPQLRLGIALTRLELKTHRAHLSDGSVVTYDRMVSTLPLSALARLTDEIPGDVASEASRLKANATTLLHVMVPIPHLGEGLHWLYVPAKEVPFYRVTFQHTINPSSVRPGWSLLTLELGGNPSSRLEAAKGSLKALRELGFLPLSEMLVKTTFDVIPTGYVIYNAAWASARQQVLSHFQRHQVLCLGRYGRWEYSNMESALLQGREVSSRLQSLSLEATHASHLTLLSPPETETPLPSSAVQRYFATRYPSRRNPLSGILFRRGEDARLKLILRWVPHQEALSVLDVGCGDGRFLERVLRGRPARIQVEDVSALPLEAAVKRLRFKADSLRSRLGTATTYAGQQHFDLVLALGLFDYVPDWPQLLTALLRRTKGLLIADFPRNDTRHSRFRRPWLQVNGVTLQATRLSDLEGLLSNVLEPINAGKSFAFKATVETLAFQYVVKLERVAQDSLAQEVA